MKVFWDGGGGVIIVYNGSNHRWYNYESVVKRKRERDELALGITVTVIAKCEIYLQANEVAKAPLRREDLISPVISSPLDSIQLIKRVERYLK